VRECDANFAGFDTQQTFIQKRAQVEPTQLAHAQHSLSLQHGLHGVHAGHAPRARDDDRGAAAANEGTNLLVLGGGVSIFSVNEMP
jgi:hypothetical protein